METKTFELISLVIQGIIAIGAIIFGLWQIFINRRLSKIQDFVAVALVPQNNIIKLLNTGKINLYIHSFEVDDKVMKLDRGRLISSASLDSSYYWLPANIVPQGKKFNVKIYLMDEFDNKYITEGGGESDQKDEVEKFTFRIWTYKTYKFNWIF